MSADGVLGVRVLDSGEGCPTIPIVEGPGVARAVLWPGSGGLMRSLHRILLEPGARTLALRHAMEAVYYVRTGTATVLDEDAAVEHVVPGGSMVFVEPGTGYRIVAAHESLELVGGPSPPDPSLYVRLELP